MKRSYLCIFIVFIFIALTLSSCSLLFKKKTYPLESESSMYQHEEKPPIVDESLKDFIPLIYDKHSLNNHSMGWIYVPDTGIDDVVLSAPSKPYDYYTYTGFDGTPNSKGAYFAHYMLDFGDGTRNNLERNTTIFGHSFSENPESGLFSGLKNYYNEKFAKTHPYIYFSTWKENMAFEVVAVFESHVDLRYFDSTLSNREYNEILGKVLESSIYNYENNEVLPDDKIIMLSTCAMNVQGHSDIDPYNTDYRFVVMGKLVQPYEATKDQADFTVNPTPAPPDKFKD